MRPSSFDDAGRPLAPTTPALEREDPAEARERRATLVARLVREGSLSDVRVIDAMSRVPRHLFVPAHVDDLAYEDRPLPIGHGQTISQPTIVAMMTEALALTGTERVLEIGAGSGYQAAILHHLAREVLSIEIVPALAAHARAVLARIGASRVRVRAGNGYLGWPEEAPFDRILLTAAPVEIPAELVRQLAEGGLLVAPVGGSFDQSLVRGKKVGGRLELEDLGPVAFVPMVAEAAPGAWS